ncbi:geranylgeranyl reductase family protein [Epidermidibacterium keratini]|uniref:Geranylgeranyl reductase family protein n=1 Tax=Epidermidibacterium keratini TaxID=1891644 RepID=A0A7L4YMI9_9ACTN|nr:geranylgeranyl reductase family protein [Epidermidibacterium keratini]QHB99756.1 geranylgeranyl reductase family protein [Epidermidibacterium keratini]
MSAVRAHTDADVIVVGAGPGGSAAAYHAALHGLDVLLLEKGVFPREKVCGDGLTPRAVKNIVAMGIDTSEGNPGGDGIGGGWIRNKGLRVIGGGLRLELDWPELASFPDYGLVRPRADFDELLARRAQQVGAKLIEQCNVTGAVHDDSGRVTGVVAKVGPGKEPQEFRAPVVIAADGMGGRLGLGEGIVRDDKRPMGVAVRRYYRSPRHDDNYLESWLELWEDTPDGGRRLLPGYGWIFGVGDGTSNVGLGILNSSASFQDINYRDLLVRWLGGLPEEWGFVEDNAEGPTRGGGLPMGFNKHPHYRDGLLLVGDAGGAINPFNGEGIAYAMETGELAAEAVAQSFGRRTAQSRERALEGYNGALADHLGSYYRLGGVFVKLIGNPHIMRIATKHGLPRPLLMKFVLKMMANLTDPRDGDAMDRILNGLQKITPAVR